MKNAFKFLMILVILFSFIVSCKPTKDVSTVTIGQSMWFEREMTLSMWQLDSLCHADTLSTNLDEWITTKFKDYETGEPVCKRMYIKDNGKRQTVYILNGFHSPYKFTKRISE